MHRKVGRADDSTGLVTTSPKPLDQLLLFATTLTSIQEPRIATHVVSVSSNKLQIRHRSRKVKGV